jgi:hypothetical protein
MHNGEPLLSSPETSIMMAAMERRCTRWQISST